MVDIRIINIVILGNIYYILISAILYRYENFKIIHRNSMKRKKNHWKLMLLTKMK